MAVLQLMAQEKTARSYRFTDTTVERLNKLEGRLPTMDRTTIVETAIGHLLGSLEQGEGVYLAVPSEAQKAHKKGPADV
jgi:hypothetical protein